MNSGIYKITSPSGKVYIGISSDLKRRMNQYSRLNCSNQPLLYRSLLKYGFENHTVEVIYYSDDYNELLEKEVQYIAEFKSNINRYKDLGIGLNLTDGGEGTKGYKRTEEEKLNMSLRMKGKYLGKKNPNYGKKVSLETKEKIRQKTLGRKLSEETKQKLKEVSKKMWEDRWEELYKRIFTDEFKKNLSKIAKSRVVSKETRIKMSENSAKNKSKLVLNLETGIYYESIKEASITTIWAESTLRSMLNPNNRQINKSSFIKV